MVDAKYRQSINQRRGTLAAVRDRFDLTLECIRLHYEGRDSPLADVLARHSNYFNLFEDFCGYVDHFLLNDVVEADYSTLRYLSDFGVLGTESLPDRLDAYREYAQRSANFIQARNARIAAYSETLLSDA